MPGDATSAAVAMVEAAVHAAVTQTALLQDLLSSSRVK
jgi:hypothetical protein